MTKLFVKDLLMITVGKVKLDIVSNMKYTPPLHSKVATATDLLAEYGDDYLKNSRVMVIETKEDYIDVSAIHDEDWENVPN